MQMTEYLAGDNWRHIDRQLPYEYLGKRVWFYDANGAVYDGYVLSQQTQLEEWLKRYKITHWKPYIPTPPQGYTHITDDDLGTLIENVAVVGYTPSGGRIGSYIHISDKGPKYREFSGREVLGLIKLNMGFPEK